MDRIRTAFSYSIIIFFLLFLTVTGACLFLRPQQSFSENENRVLQTLPKPTVETILDGSWQEKFEDFTTDQFPLRDRFTAAGSIFKYAIGNRDIGGAYIGGSDGQEVRLFEKSDTLSMSDAAQTLSSLQAFADALSKWDRALRMALLPVPSAGTVYRDELPAFAQVFDGEAFIDSAKATLANSACRVADPLPALRRSAEADGAVYYRTDHHWTASGAAAAYAACCDALGLTPMPTEQVFSFARLSTTFSGTLSSKVLLPFVKPDEIYRPTLDVSTVRVYMGSGFAEETLQEIALYQPEALGKKDNYTYFLGGNYGFVLLENKALTDNDQTLLILKDSFANSFVPYLTAHYRRVVMVDPRYYRGEFLTLLEDYPPDALLLLYECDNFANDRFLPYLLTHTAETMEAKLSAPAVAAPLFSAESGFYEDAFSLTLTATEGATIYYTLDGSDPGRRSLLYGGPIDIYDRSGEPNRLLANQNIIVEYHDKWTEADPVDKAFVVRAVALDAYGNRSDVVTKTYFVNLQGYADRRVVSLVTDPDNLFGEKGIYVTGEAYDAWYEQVYEAQQRGDDKGAKALGPRPAVNYRQKGIAWERPANFEVFDGGQRYLDQEVGIRIQGAASRDNLRKRFSVYARKDYSGNNYFDLSPFDGSAEKVHAVVLRNVFINSFSQALIEDRYVAVQKSTPVAVFVNGEFLYDTYLQEKYTEAFFADEYNLTKSNIEVVKIGRWNDLTEAEKANYENSITAFIKNHDLAAPENYAAFGEIVNLQSYIDFSCINIYLGNADLIDKKNSVLWRTHRKENDEYGDTRWNWALYDMDLLTGTVRDELGLKTNAEVDSFSQGGINVDYIPYNKTDIYAALRVNPDFCRQFVLTFMDLVNTTFSVEHVAAIFTNWEEYTIDSYDDGFFLHRADYIVPFMAAEFELTGSPVPVVLSADKADVSITLNTITPTLQRADDGGYVWSGSYFTDYPVTVTANDENFSHWEVTTGDSIQIYLDRTVELTLPEGGLQVYAVYEE